MKYKLHRTLLIIFVLVFAISCIGEASVVRKKIAVKAGRIITIASEDIHNGVILIEDGKIKAVGKNVEIPWDAFVIEAVDRIVMPGFVLAHTFSGLDRANENMPETPFLSTFDSIDPISPFFEDCLRDGVTTMLVLPGNNTLLGGTGTVVRPHGLTVEAMLVKPYTGLKISLRPSRNTSRMGHIQRFRRYMDDLQRYLDEYERRKAEAKEEKKPFDEEIDDQKQPMVDLLDGKLTAFIYCDRATDVPAAIRIQQEHKLKAVLVLSAECYKAADLIAASKLPVVLPPDLVIWETDEMTQEEQMVVLPAIFDKAGVRFAFQTDTSDYGSRYLWYQAATAVKYGMKRAEALKSITLYPAQLMGVEDRFGSVQPDKEATLLFLTGDPLDVQTWVDKVMIAGEIVYERDKDKRLKELLEEPQVPQQPQDTD